MTTRMWGLPLLAICFAGCTQDTLPAPVTTNTTSSDAESSADATTENVAAATDAVAQEEPSVEQTAVDPRAIEEISFDDLNLQLQADVVFRPFMLTDRARELDGRQVRISGYMLPYTQREGITNFVLLRNTECKFGTGGQADHLINVTMDEGGETSYRASPIQVDGRLEIAPYQGPDGNTWYIFELNAARDIVTLRR